MRSHARPRSCLFGVVAGAAYQSYGMSSVRYSADPGDVTSGNARQPLELRTIVSFVELPDKALVEAVKPAPRLLPTFPEVPPPPQAKRSHTCRMRAHVVERMSWAAVPQDMFYPFEWQETEEKTSGGGTAAAPSLGLAVAAAVAVLAVVWPR